VKKILIAASLLINVNICFATQQIPDLLIVGKDTFMLYSFPLQALNLAQAPFDYGGYSFPGTNCYRGYQATWKILDNKLFLVHINKVDSTRKELDIVKYFKENNYYPTIINGLIFADWYSVKFRYWDRWNPRFQNIIYSPIDNKVIFPILEIKSGYIIKNKLYTP
jgi:hypothetical protein